MPEPLCRDHVDPRKPCQFAGVCHDERQALQHRYKLVGPACWAYELVIAEQAYAPPEESAVP